MAPKRRYKHYAEVVRRSMRLANHDNLPSTSSEVPPITPTIESTPPPPPLHWPPKLLHTPQSLRRKRRTHITGEDGRPKDNAEGHDNTQGEGGARSGAGGKGTSCEQSAGAEGSNMHVEGWAEEEGLDRLFGEKER
ncbi:hypothetical protein KC19_VG221800 [Ceratodon purpureus]|uniref:Uncharacterized protein n=1 Tax=Ceratodon purpureus TaxID=3225 RepID=A0A8T0HT37_CERPU|nr:hypothetical protein KC19_VG221800 [Ceratodon purpureus]